MNDKKQIRAYYLDLMKRQGELARQQKSSAIAKQLLSHEMFKKAKTVLFYASLPGEVDTFAMIRETIQLKKITALPIVNLKTKMLNPAAIYSTDDLFPGAYGVFEPVIERSVLVNPSDLDVVIVPGIAFDRNNNRLGRGAGYYDRFLSQLPESAHTIGLAFDFQVADSLPLDGHDIAVDCLITA